MYRPTFCLSLEGFAKILFEGSMFESLSVHQNVKLWNVYISWPRADRDFNTLSEIFIIRLSYDGSYYGMGSVRLSVNLYLVNAITSEIIDPASPNSVCGFFMVRSRMSSYLAGSIWCTFKVSEVNAVYQLVHKCRQLYALTKWNKRFTMNAITDLGGAVNTPYPPFSRARLNT